MQRVNVIKNQLNLKKQQQQKKSKINKFENIFSKELEKNKSKVYN